MNKKKYIKNEWSKWASFTGLIQRLPNSEFSFAAVFAEALSVAEVLAVFFSVTPAVAAAALIMPAVAVVSTSFVFLPLAAFVTLAGSLKLLAVAFSAVPLLAFFCKLPLFVSEKMLTEIQVLTFKSKFY